MGNELRVGEVMSPDPIYVHEGDLATKVRAVLRRTGYRSLPVLDEDSRVAGLITVREMLSITSTRSNINAEGIMSPVLVSLVPEEGLMQAVGKMLEASVDRAVVVDSPQGMRLLGLLSIHDVMRALQGVDTQVKDLQVGGIMTREVVTCAPSDPVTGVWRRMEEAAFSGLPVVKKKRVVGMITRKDIIAAGYARIRKESEKDFSTSAAVVRKVMSSPAIKVSPGARMSEAMEVMLAGNIGRLPVAEKGGLVGIIDREDIMKQFLEEYDA